MNRKLLGTVGILVAILASVLGANYLILQSPMAEVLTTDARNEGISVTVHFGKYVDPSELIFDLREVSSSNSPADVSRVLFQYAQALKTMEFDRMILAYKGTPRFQLKGQYFRELGEEFGLQNPVYTMRTFSENVHELDGTAAFGTWTGGLLGVVGKQMEDFNEFHERWYVAEIARGK
ncbi:MAG: hypothetical protein RQ826_13625 [Xanthomonadales bacterium]|nr:hypothetical protein [Xanthomonadales bacterium]